MSLKISSPTLVRCGAQLPSLSVEVRGPLPRDKLVSVWNLNPTGRTEVIAQVKLGKFELHLVDSKGRIYEIIEVEVSDTEDRFEPVFKNCKPI